MNDQKSSSSRGRLRKWAWKTIRITSFLLFLGYIFLLSLPIACGIIFLPSRSEKTPHLRNGLLPVETKVPLKTVADVIFVHGLGSFPDSTWHKPFPGKKTKYPEGVHWIRDLLPADVPDARLLLFNYDSTTYHDAPQKTLETIGGELLFSIEHWRANDTEAQQNDYPIIFVCHSYGGLVVKEALRLASIKANGINSNPLQHTWGTIFLGVPHAGTEDSWYTYQFAKFLSSIGSNPSIFLPLARDSKDLAKLHEDFMKSYVYVKKVNFFETRRQVIIKPLGRFSPTRMIVPITSATFNGTNTENYSLDYDHSGLNKYNNVSDEGYVKVVSVLNNMTRSITEEEYKSGLRKAGVEESLSQITRGLKSHRCNTEQCRNELYSAWGHILTDRFLEHERQRVATEEWIAKMEDGWWKTTCSWVAYFYYLFSYSNKEEGWGRGRSDHDRWHY